MFQAKELSFTVTFIINTLILKTIKKHYANNKKQPCFGEDWLNID